ncbi:Nuclear pore complex protein NUP96 [Ananas comosus]|uniref:Nuclear pore complex protein NUP96 n=1 Tax=Ananas comosus TaxID=4615 RepID=A0A199VNW0_ANACO|nr:Nuclear pore complex protein NUP96 [Ananas comosus]
MDIEASLPSLHSPSYYTEPSLDELAKIEAIDSGYCSRVPNFVVGKVGYGCVKFLSNTDIRWINLDKIVKFDHNSVTVYVDEADKPPVGHGLNKAAEVTLILRLRSKSSDYLESNRLLNKLGRICLKQGAKFVSFEPSNGEWKFMVEHFSRFGLDDDEEEDVVMDDAAVQPSSEVKDSQLSSNGLELSRSLPAHLGLDPAKVQEMRMLLFPGEDDNDDDTEQNLFPDKRYTSREAMKVDSPITRKFHNKATPIPKRAPQALLEYHTSSSELSPLNNILLSGQSKGLAAKRAKIEGFKLEGKYSSPVGVKYSNCVVDAALFMGRSFRVGWGPNGVLVHSGSPVRNPNSGLSSIVNVEKVAVDRAVRDEKNKFREDLVDLCFSSPLFLHKSLDREYNEIEADSFGLKLQKVVTNRSMLLEICRAYIEIIEKQLEVDELSTSYRVLLMHQVTVWELIKVLFSERGRNGNGPLNITYNEDGEDMMLDKKDSSSDIDFESYPLVRRADFSYWLQESVCHKIQGDISCLNESNYLENILLLLTGRQLDEAVEMASSKGDVRLAILLSQAGGSMINRADVAQQLDLWRTNGLDFSFIEKERLKLYELLAGNIQIAAQDHSIDWKRYLGLLMWYHLPPDTSLSVIIHTYQQLVSERKVPYPVPVYIDEGPLDEAPEWNSGDRFDILYYLMLLHANGEENSSSSLLKTLFSAYSSSYDPLDYHMIWHQRSILEAIGAFSSSDLHVLDMSFVYQLLCVGQCHWAIYVVLHMPYLEDFPCIQANIIKEILLQYCESWSREEKQRQFIEELGVPTAWMHEALAIYFQYYGDQSKALEHFIESANWQKAHSIFVTSAAPPLFLALKHSEIWRITSSMEEHKSEIADWDVGAGIYIDFYILRSSFQEENAMSDLGKLESKNEVCKNFFSRLNDSLLVWGSRLTVEARAAYSKMAEELCALLMSTSGEKSTPEVQMSSFDTMLTAPIPEEHRAGYLQEAVSVFTYLLTEPAS